MATIYSLNTSITQLSEEDIISKLMEIRTNRRRKPERSMRAQKSTPAKVARAPKKTSLKSHEMFQFAKGLSEEAKAKLVAELLGGLK